MLGRIAEPQLPLMAALATLVQRPERPAGRSGDIRTADRVDLERFAGQWYVIASIPTPIDRDACNATEHYRIRDDGTVDATYSFNRGSADGRALKIRRTGIVRDDGSNAVWDIRFAGPIAADYRILYVDDDYGDAIVGRNRRDYAWVLSRQAEMPSELLFEHVRRLREAGYDSSRVRTVPQVWR